MFDLNPSLFSYDVLSDEKVLAEIEGSGESEAVIDFGKISVYGDKTPNALLCWYRIEFSNHHEIDTKRKNSFINHTAIILEDQLEDAVLQKTNVKLRIFKMGDLVKISL